ncbi:hypothetical protein NGI46_07905 [Peribacillus butanolivorans]|uniref:hypothetical protein n=1 Tax=Peribacillus butanolivorans TaxID=421767 RepID=UPI00207D153C|nr:hypothetical protein [Peribacillus butanolivorans]MCO0597390.1 hypothetical protein [Peribacillus butanolivorans]
MNGIWDVHKKDKEGNKFVIKVRFDERRNELNISDVGYTPKGKRKVTFIGDSLGDDYGWRALTCEDRRDAQIQEILKYVSKEMLMEALIEAWEQSKPKGLLF